MTPVRNLRVSGDVWDTALAKARAEGKTITEVIVGCLKRYNAAVPDETTDAGSPAPAPTFQIRTWNDADDGSYSWKPSWNEWEDVDQEWEYVGGVKVQVRVKPTEDEGGN